MLFRTYVLDPLLPVMLVKLYGPQLPLAALVTQRGPEPPAGGLAEVGLELGDELVVLGLGEPGSDAPVLGEPPLEDTGDDGKAVVVLDVAEVLGECGAALLMNGLQPVNATIIADTAIAGQIRFGFTSKLLYLLVI
jgi:hypothetical protein